MALIGEVSVGVTANTAKATKNLRRVQKEVRKTSKSVDDASKSFRMFSTAFAAIGGLAAGRSLVNTFLETATAIDAVAKSASGLGATTQELLGLHHAAKAFGADGEVINKILARQTELYEQNHEALRRLGLDYQRLQKMGIKDQFLSITDAIKTYGNATQQLGIAQELFGEDALRGINLIKASRTEIEALAGQVEKLGASYSTQGAAGVEAFNDALERLKLAFGAGVVRLVVAVSPKLEALINAALGPEVTDERVGRENRRPLRFGGVRPVPPWMQRAWNFLTEIHRGDPTRGINAPALMPPDQKRRIQESEHRARTEQYKEDLARSREQARLNRLREAQEQYQARDVRDTFADILRQLIGFAPQKDAQFAAPTRKGQNDSLAVQKQTLAELKLINQSENVIIRLGF